MNNISRMLINPNGKYLLSITDYELTSFIPVVRLNVAPNPPPIKTILG